MSNILLLEDDMFLADDLKAIIEFDGHSITHIDTASKFLKKFKTLDVYDAIVLDLMMITPDEIQDKNSNFHAGELLYELIRKEYSNLPIVILTAKQNVLINTKNDSKTTIVKKPLNDVDVILDEINKLS